MESRASRFAVHLVISALLAFTLSAASQVPAAWGDLQPGPYEVGFRAFHEEDRTRGYWPLHDYRGQEREESTYRPMQVSVWYPAVEGADAEPLRYRDYVELQEMALGESHREVLRAAVDAELRSDFFGGFFPPEGPDDEELEAILDQPMAALRDARPRTGKFPVVIHSGFGPLAQSVLLEYLASHGYIVLTVPMLGSDAAWFNRGSGTLEWWLEVARDIAWLRAFASDLPMTDIRRTGVIGMTGSAGMLEQMSSMQLSAIVATEATWRDVLTEAAVFEPARVRIPILDITSKGRNNRDLLERFLFSDRWIVRLDEVEHADLYQFRRLTGPDAALEHTGYATTARLTRLFLDAHLKGVESEWSERSLRSVSSDALTMTHLDASTPIPSEREFLLLVREGKSSEAERAYRTAASAGHSEFFDPDALRTTGIFRLYDDDDAEGAATAFRILVDAYPEDVEGYRFLGRALLALGDTSGARRALERASEILASLDLSDEERERLRQRIDQDLSRLPTDQ